MRRASSFPGPDLPPIPYPYSVRVATEEDAERIAEVLTAAFEEEWSLERVRGELLQNPGVPTTYVAQRENNIVGTASFQVQEAYLEGAFLHWVGVHPKWRGKHLAMHLCTEVIRQTRDAGLANCYLTTEDFRLPAILSYLRLGFVPMLTDDSHAERWRIVYGQLRRQESAV